MDHQPDRTWSISIPSRFIDVAAAHPARVAVSTPRGDLTYSAVQDLALRVAAALLRTCGPEAGTVALALTAPEHMVPAILGTLMAGKIYAPFDPAYPEQRLRHMLEDAQPQAILVDDVWGRALTLNGSGARRLNLHEAAATESMAVSAIAKDPDALASLLYTSGSTGRPKGVLQNHRNVLFHVRNLTARFGISPDDRHSLLASFSFDASTTDLYCALLNGAALVPIDLANDGLAHLGRRLREQRISLYHSTPTVFRHIAQVADPPAAFPDLRLILLGGEPMGIRDTALFNRHCSPGCLLVNGYGATETGGFLAWHVMSHGDHVPGPVIPIGRAVDGVDLVLRDQTGLDAEPTGELLAFSAHLGVGYWNDPEGTAAVFTTEERGGRTVQVYRTGDVAARLADGTLRLQGRLDRQVKVRGQRLELGEIESVLASLPSVQQAAVTLNRDNRTDGGALTAYLKLFSSTGEALVDVRRSLAKLLPSYMIPSTFILVEQLPMTPTGKLDVAALTSAETSCPTTTPEIAMGDGDGADRCPRLVRGAHARRRRARRKLL